MLAIPAAMLVVAALVVAVPRLLPGGSHHHVSLSQSPTRSAGVRCRAGPVPPTPVGARVLTADVAAKGCATTAVWTGNVLSVDLGEGAWAARFALGQPGDEALLGDWNCSGRATPALYRPSTGEIFYFGGWAAPGQPLVSQRVVRTRMLNGQAHLHTRPGGCEVVEIRQQKP